MVLDPRDGCGPDQPEPTNSKAKEVYLRDKKIHWLDRCGTERAQGYREQATHQEASLLDSKAQTALWPRQAGYETTPCSEREESGSPRGQSPPVQKSQRQNGNCWPKEPEAEDADAGGPPRKLYKEILQEDCKPDQTQALGGSRWRRNCRIGW